MGQHTWFAKDRLVHETIERLSELIYDTEDVYIDVHAFEIISDELDKLSENNRHDFHDVFRTSLRNSDNTYTDVTLKSYEETIKFIEDPVNHCYAIMDSYKKYMGEFWEQHPRGLIYFG